MADEADVSNDIAEVLLTAQLSERKPEGPKATGKCLSCETEVGEGHRWCDADCRSDWETFNTRGTYG